MEWVPFAASGTTVGQISSGERGLIEWYGGEIHRVGVVQLLACGTKLVTPLSLAWEFIFNGHVCVPQNITKLLERLLAFPYKRWQIASVFIQVLYCCLCESSKLCWLSISSSEYSKTLVLVVKLLLCYLTCFSFHPLENYLIFCWIGGTGCLVFNVYLGMCFKLV